MKSLRIASIFSRSAGILSVALLALSAACSTETATAPQVTAKNGLLGDVVGGVVGTATGLLSPAKVLTRDVAVPAITRSFTFTRAGGSINIPEAGLIVDVPAEAIPTSSLTITVTVLPGKSIAYDFQPHGTQFRRPLTFRQELNGTSWDASTFRGTLNGGYFKNTAQVDLLRGLALVDEILPITVRLHEARFNINHFSGYMVSSGRQSAYSEEF